MTSAYTRAFSFSLSPSPLGALQTSRLLLCLLFPSFFPPLRFLVSVCLSASSFPLLYHTHTTSCSPSPCLVTLFPRARPSVSLFALIPRSLPLPLPPPLPSVAWFSLSCPTYLPSQSPSSLSHSLTHAPAARLVPHPLVPP